MSPVWVSPVWWTGGDGLAEVQRRCSRPPVPLLGGQRDDGAAVDVFLQQVDELFVRAAVERLQQQNAGSLRGVLIVLIRWGDQGGFKILNVLILLSVLLFDVMFLDWFWYMLYQLISVLLFFLLITDWLLCYTGLINRTRTTINSDKLITNNLNCQDIFKQKITDSNMKIFCFSCDNKLKIFDRLINNKYNRCLQQ